MLPFAVINDTAEHAPRPVSWSSKHHFEVRTTEIPQPKPKIADGTQTHPRSDIRGTEKEVIPIEQLNNPHVIDSSRQPIKSFKLG